MAEPRRPDSIPGYEHPDSNSISDSARGGVYKTFSEKKPKGDKKEKFGKTVAGSLYTSYNDKEVEDNNCPVCNDLAVYNCPCVHSDKRCAQGHVWYTGRDGKVKKGNPHLNSNSSGCS